jgi:uncharacterized protein YbjT (DUF2867 family)
MMKTIAVVGACGHQGQGVVDACLKRGWKVRALTRKPESENSMKLRALGAEIVVANIDKPDDLKKAFTGVDAVFAMTNYYEAGPEGEEREGKLMIDIAKQLGIKHFILSTLVNAEKISGGKNKVPHFTSKGRVEEYLFNSGLPATSVQIACYFENWQNTFLPKLNGSGNYEFTLNVPGDSKMALASVYDLGPVVAGILDRKDQFLGKSIPVTGDYLTPNEMAAIFTKVWKKNVRANIVPKEKFASLPMPNAEEMGDMFEFFHKFGYFGEKVNGKDIWEGKKIYPGILSFEQWLRNTMPQPPTVLQSK